MTKLHNLYTSENVFKVVKSRMMYWLLLVARMVIREIQNLDALFSGEREHI
jgi:G:T-mismatch repair DNA endonuclease (very short patch repair protein)